MYKKREKIYYTPSDTGYERCIKEMMKERIRSYAKEIRRELKDKEERSRRIKELLFSQKEFKEASCILFYASKEDEVNTMDAMRGAILSKKIVLPKVKEDTLSLYMIDDLRKLKKGAFGILEPEEGKEVKEEEVSVAIIPGVAFDRRGVRIGHGAGFYDRFLSKMKGKIPLIALAFSCQLFSYIPKTSTDVSVDKIITEEGVIECETL
jgi:5-formyltetrahydrofolate cyclo-ligase